MTSYTEIRNLQEPSWGHIVENFVDDGYSAKDTNRPAYTRLMKAINSGKINAIMVTELSRLSRNIPDFCDFHKMLESQGAKFFSIKEQFDSSTPPGKMMLYNMINLAQFEREQTSERVAINCHSRAQRGFLNGGPSILGYDKDPSKKATFIVNQNEAHQVRRIFELFMEHRTLSRTIDAISAEGIKPKLRKIAKNRMANEGRWTSDSLSFTIRNRAYIGIREVNKRNKDKDPHKLKPWQRYGTFPASWPAILDENTFNTVKKILDGNTLRERMRLNTSASRVFAASGICVCEECGRKLVGQSAHGRKQVHRYYVHSTKKGDVIECKVKRIKADQIENKISEYLSEILLRAGHFEKIEERIKELASHSPEKLKIDRDRIALELKKITLAIKNTFKIQSALNAESEAIRETARELEELSRTKRYLEAELETLKSKELAKEDVEDAVEDLKERLNSFRKGWSKASAVTKKSLLNDLIYFILVGPKGLKIQFRLKHTELNKDLNKADPKSSHSNEDNVIDLKEKTRAKTPAPEPSGLDSVYNNLSIMGSQNVGNGREYRIRTCDIHLVRVALYQLS